MEHSLEIRPDILELFENLSFLGRGGQGITFRATRITDQKEVVLKVLDFLELSSWKNYDLFLREIAILKTLNHPAIPKVLAVFPQTPQDEPEAVVLVQEYFEGDSLKALLDASDDEVWSDEKVLGFLEEMLQILSYLHALNPPVVHRDIKPSNIICRADGTYALIDFGAASATQKTSGSTFVGTNGYMAPEQMMGRAEPRSDLYSLGATALQLATGMHPNDLTRADFSTRFDGLGLSANLVRILERLVHPLPEKRFRDARQVLRSLSPSTELVLANISENGFTLVRRDEETQIDMPGPARSRLGTLLFLSLAFTSSIWFLPVRTFLVVVVLPTLLFVMGSALFRLFRRRKLFVDDYSLRFVRKFGPYSRVKTWSIDEIIDVRSQKRRDGFDVVLQDKSAARHSLRGGLSNKQAEWLVRTIQAEFEERR